MFKARFKKYWCDYVSTEVVTLKTTTIEEIFEYAYKIYKDSCVESWRKRFSIKGSSRGISGFLAIDNVLPEKGGYYGSMWLEEITYYGSVEETIVFLRNKYTSPKTSEALDKFARVVKQREESKKFGDF